MAQRFLAATATLLIGVAVFGLDQGTKLLWFSPANDLGTGGWSLVRLTAHMNQGVSFNLPSPTWFPVTVAALVILGALGWSFLRSPRRPLAWLALGLIIGGAAGNALDRISLGFVRDWLLWFEISAINLADVSIVAGFCVFWWQQKRNAKT